MSGWKEYLFEFISIFVALIAAFALDNWKESRNDKKIEHRILQEIKYGLDKDIEDIRTNMLGHKQGIVAAEFFIRAVNGEKVGNDSVKQQTINLHRDFLSIQNVSGYESLKSKGLELISNDSLRTRIINIYEHDYTTLRKLEEEYHELQFQKNYYPLFSQLIAPAFQFDEKHMINGIQPIHLNGSDKNRLQTDFFKMRFNRNWMLEIYNESIERINHLKTNISMELSQ